MKGAITLPPCLRDSRNDSCTVVQATVYFFSSVLSVCPAHLLLHDFITLNVGGEKQGNKLWDPRHGVS